MAPEIPLKCHLSGVCPASSLSFCYKKRGGGAPPCGLFPQHPLWMDPGKLAQTQSGLLRASLGVALLVAYSEDRFRLGNKLCALKGWRLTRLPTSSPRIKSCLKQICFLGKTVSSSFTFPVKYNVWNSLLFLILSGNEDPGVTVVFKVNLVNWMWLHVKKNRQLWARAGKGENSTL